jgi:hypothetical protein
MTNPIVFVTIAKLFGKGALASPSMMHAAEPNEIGILGLLFGLIWSKRQKRLANRTANASSEGPVARGTSPQSSN